MDRKMPANIALERKNGIAPPPRGSDQGNVAGQGINQGGRQGVRATINVEIDNKTVTPTAPQGPLAKLNETKYKLASYSYPSDLENDSGPAHIMQFYINETKGSQANPSADSNLVDKTLETFKTIETKLNESGARVWQPERARISNSISLYIPDSIVTSYGANYNETSLAEGIQDIGNMLSATGKKLEDMTGFSALLKGLGGVATGAIDAAQSSAGKLALSAAFGKAFNPRKQVLFEGIDFRTFSFTFIFTPTSREESNQVNDIIRLFKYHSAPTIQSGTFNGFFFIPPSSFTIQFFYRDNTGTITENPYVNKIAESVLEKVDVNYSPNGIWSAFDGTGAPTQVQLTLSFKEIELIDKTLIGDVGSSQGGF